jgi:hypothetical protein
MERLVPPYPKDKRSFRSGDTFQSTEGLLVRSGDKYVSNVPIRDSATTGCKFAYRIRSTILDE